MKKAMKMLKVAALAVGISTVAWAAVAPPTPASAAGVLCGGKGDTCTVIHNGKTYYLDKKGAPEY